MEIVDIQPGAWGYEEYSLIPTDGRRHEILGGCHVVSPSPSIYHQLLSGRIQYQLYSQIAVPMRGLILSAPVDVQLSEHDIVQPDLVVILERNAQIVTHSKVLGAPDLLVEILSPSSVSNDRELKRHLYERTGVSEHWIVDPDVKTVSQLVLVGGKYESREHGAELRPTILEGVTVRLNEVW